MNREESEGIFFGCLVFVLSIVFYVGIVLGFVWLLGFVGCWPGRYLHSNRINGLCGVKLCEKWDGHTWTRFRDFQKDAVEMTDSGIVYKVRIKSPTANLKDTIALVEKRFDVKLKQYSYDDRRDGIAKKKTDYYYDDRIYGNVVWVEEDIVREVREENPNYKKHTSPNLHYIDHSPYVPDEYFSTSKYVVDVHYVYISVINNKLDKEESDRAKAIKEARLRQELKAL